jgi:hypothetical protein
MAEETLVKLKLSEGRYVGELSAPDGTGIEAVHAGRVVATAHVSPGDGGRHRVSLDIPPGVLSDGVQVVALRSTVTGTTLDRVTVQAGEILDEDLHAEIALLRDELELLKKAFRQHVREEGNR